MDITLNQLKAIFAEIAEKHKEIKGFHWGDFLDAISDENAALYPLLVCTTQPAPMSKQTVGMNITVSIWDKYNEGDWIQLDNVFSDTLGTVVDIKNILLSYRFEDLFSTEFTTNNTPTKHKGQDLAAGWWFNVNFGIYDSANYCGIPIDDSFEFLERGKNFQ